MGSKTIKKSQKLLQTAAWWDDSNLEPLLSRVEVPVYLGCDWQNVPLHLPHTFPAFQKLTNSRRVQVAMLGEYGLTT